MQSPSPNVKLFSLNVKGIRGTEKRRNVFNWLSKKNSDIFLLQETYSTENISKYFSMSWKGESLLSHGTNHSKGVAILFKKHLDYEIINKHIDDDGRYIICDLKVRGTPVILVNIYAPCGKSKDQVPFYDKLYNILKDLNIADKYVVLGGDFNIILNHNLDRDGGSFHQKAKAYDAVCKILSHFNLIDIWRTQNPYLRKYTWRQRTPIIQSRLDYWFISQNLQDFVGNCTINPAIYTDHSSINLNLDSKTFSKHGPSYWKFNDSLCNDVNYVNELKEKAIEWCQKYSDVLDDRVKWDLIKFEIRCFTQTYSKNKVKESKQRLFELEKKFKIAEEALNSNPCNATQTVWENLKFELNEYYDHDSQGVYVRSRADWMEKGEKNNKYFLNLEKSNKINSTMRCIVTDDGTESYDDNVILKGIKNFYTSLYSAKDVNLNSPQSDMFLHNEHIPKLSLDDQRSCEGDLSNMECYKMLCKMSTGKSPGNDGLTVMFYKTFWNIFGNLVVNSLNYAYNKGELSNSQKQGVITLILKNSKDKRKVENYRPITLLNVDFKIGSKVIAERIAKVVPELISCHQSAFVEGRYIGDAVRTVADVLHYTRDKNLPGILLSIDFQKAYDSIDHNYMYKVLKAFNFGQSLCKWIETFYRDISSCVMNNGTSTGYFTIQRGLRQGDPLSCQLFNLVLETLCIVLITKGGINGIQLSPDKQVKMSCYADDMCLFVRDVNSAKCVMNVFRDFETCSSLQVNYNKTEAMWIGSTRNNVSKPLDVHWTKKVKVLGVYFTYNDKDFYNLNYDDKLKSLERVVNMWRQRDLSVIGKITIVKTFGFSKLMYTASMIGMPVHIQKKVNDIVFKYIWNGPDKIKRSVLCSDLNKGGLKMFDLKLKVKTQGIMWVKRFLEPNEADWKNILVRYLKPCGGKDLLKHNFDVNKLPEYINIPPFYFNAFKLWSEINCTNPANVDDVCKQSIWNNKFILINNKSVYYAKFQEAGFHTIYDFFEDENTIKDISGFNNFTRVDQMKYYGLISAIPKQWRKMIRENGLKYHDKLEYGINLLNGFTPLDKIISKNVYLWYIEHGSIEPVSQHYFKRVFNMSDVECSNLFLLPFKATLDTKLRWFQYRVVHNILPTNVWLKKIGIINSDLCTFCQSDKETVKHLFVECNKVTDFWQQIQNKWAILRDLDTFSICYGMLDCGNDNFMVINHITFMFKWYVYKCRVNQANFSFNAFIRLVDSTIELEYFCAQRKLALDIHFKKWNAFLH